MFGSNNMSTDCLSMYFDSEVDWIDIGCKEKAVSSVNTLIVQAFPSFLRSCQNTVCFQS
jgi:hypothetical protein